MIPTRSTSTARRLLMLAGCVVLSLTSGTASAAEPSKPPAWELWPYRIQLLTSVETSDRIAGQVDEELSAWLAARAAVLAGGSWKVEVTPASGELAHLILHDLLSIKEDAIPAAARTFDKVILLGIRNKDHNFQVQAREFDVATGLWN